MSVTIVKALDLRWGSNPGIFDHRLSEILESWRGTPYSAVDSLKRVGINCVRFIGCVLDEMSGIPKMSQMPDLRGDLCLHEPGKTAQAVRTMLRLYEPWRPVDPFSEPILPMDIFIVGPEGGGDGHGMIAGVQPSTLWHAAPSGVTVTGVGTSRQSFLRVYRTLDRWRCHAAR